MPTKRKYFIAILGLSIIIFCGSTLSCIYAMTIVGVTNNFETGIVDIRITEYQIKKEQEMKWQDNPIVLPGDTISKIPRIHNDGNDCYIRANIVVSEKNGTKNGELDKIKIQGISDKWILAEDGYYYYTEVLCTGEDVDLFQSLYFPEDLSECIMGEKFYINIGVDAIQAKNFTPQFDCAKPWGNVEILECKKEGMYDVTSFQPSDSQSFQMIYQGESKKLITNSEDFFKNFSYMMPGDCYSENIHIKNDSDDDRKLYFKSEALYDLEFLEKIKLKIITEINGQKNVFYEGNLKATELSTDVVLGVIPKNGEATFYFELEIPAELDNEYSILKRYVKWFFSTEPIMDLTELEPGNASQTGDFSNIRVRISIFGMIISILMAIVAMTALGKKGREK